MVQRKQLVEEFLAQLGALRRLSHGSGEHMLGRCGLTRSQIAVLFAFKHQSYITVGEMADRLGVSGGAATQMVEIMVKRGLLERSHDDADRRVTRLALTDAGRELSAEVKTLVSAHIASLLEGLDEDELVQLVALLGKLNQSIDSTEAKE